MNKSGIIQVCAVVNDIDKAMEKYWTLFAVGPWDVHTLTPENLREYTYLGKLVKEPFKFIVAVAMWGNIQLELVQPIEGPTIYKTFLMEKGEGWHHIKEYVANERMKATLKMYKDRGIDVIQSGRYDNDQFYYLNTEPELGVILELGNAGNVPPPGRRYPANT